MAGTPLTLQTRYQLLQYMELVVWLSCLLFINYKTLWQLCRNHGDVLTLYSAPPISRSHFSFNSSRKTVIVLPLGQDIGVFRELEVWSKFYPRSFCLQYRVILYRDISRVCSIQYCNLMYIASHCNSNEIYKYPVFEWWRRLHFLSENHFCSQAPTWLC